MTPIEALNALLDAIADFEHAAGLDEYYDYNYENRPDPLKEARNTLYEFIDKHDPAPPEPPSAIVWDTSQPWKYDLEYGLERG